MGDAPAFPLFLRDLLTLERYPPGEQGVARGIYFQSFSFALASFSFLPAPLADAAWHRSLVHWLDRLSFFCADDCLRVICENDKKKGGQDDQGKAMHHKSAYGQIGSWQRHSRSLLLTFY